MSELPPPAVKFPPPLLYFGMILLGWLLQHIFAWPEMALSASLRAVLGGLITALGIATNVPAVLKFRASGENVIPWTASERIIVSGVYRLTRNPMYLGMSLIAVGVAVLAASYAILGTAILASIIIDRLVIVREEDYLEQCFGQRYTEYKRKVRRWL